MLSFLKYLTEAAKKNKNAATKIKFGDATGKMFEILKGRFHNGGQEFPDSYRVEGKTPEEIYRKTAATSFGPDYENHPIHNNMAAAANTSAEMTERWVTGRHHHDRTKGFNRFAWTSQPADPTQFLGSKPKKAVGDNMAELSHGGNHAFSEKVTDIGSKVNYANPGVKSFEESTGVKLSQYNQAHADMLEKHGIVGEEGKQTLKNWMGENPDYTPTKQESAKAAEIEKSYTERNKNYGRDMRAAYNRMSAQDKKDGGSRLRNAIFSMVTPSTETPTTVTHTELNSDGSHHRTRVFDLHDHINQYLDHFQDLHIKPSDEDPASVTIHGVHKKTGKVMAVARMSIYGRKHQISPRGAVVLPSENHKDVKYHGELDTAGEHGDDMSKHALPEGATRMRPAQYISAPPLVKKKTRTLKAPSVVDVSPKAKQIRPKISATSSTPSLSSTTPTPSGGFGQHRGLPKHYQAYKDDTIGGHTDLAS